MGSFGDTDSTRKVKVKVAPSCPTLCNPVDFTIHGTLQARILEWVAFSFPRASSQPRDWTQVSCIALQVDSLPAEPQGKPKNTGVGSRSLLQGIFPTQGLNPGLSHCRWILYQLSHREVPGQYQNRDIFIYCRWMFAYFQSCILQIQPCAGLLVNICLYTGWLCT